MTQEPLARLIQYLNLAKAEAQRLADQRDDSRRRSLSSYSAGLAAGYEKGYMDGVADGKYGS